MSLPYAVLVDDNFHYMEEDERRLHGSFATIEEAISACVCAIASRIDRTFAGQFLKIPTGE